jgi:nicotinamide mononucleotide adenylyltransferase
MIIPVPDNYEFKLWAHELCKQDSAIPYPDDSWTAWVAQLYQSTQYPYVNPQLFQNWRSWATSFLLVNQGR